VTIAFDESPTPWNVKGWRNTIEGRQQLVKAGLWTPGQAQRHAKLQHRKAAKSRSGRFVGWDGEGVTEDERHHYIMLCNSEREILRRGKQSATIPTNKALAFLCATALRDPWCIHVMFGGSYDANMILTDLSYYECQELSAEGSLHWGDYRIEYRPRKFLMVTRYTGRHVKANKLVTMTLWDVIGFFQMSFVRTLKDWQIGAIDDTEFVAKMKDQRSDFLSSDAKEIERYCFIECDQLVEIMTKLRNHMRTVDLTPSRWDGAGALGATMLQKYKVKNHKAEVAGSESDTTKVITSTIPPEVNRAAQYGYFGGRIEVLKYGNYPHTVYSHDIVSAYPFAMTHLPCLAHGTWEHSRSLPRSEFAISRVKFSHDLGPEPFPLPWRAQNGLVYFPPVTQGWYWKPEVDMMRKHYPGHGKVLESWSFIPGCEHEPFSFIPEVFAHRQRLKRNGNLAEKVLKLGLNSIYGKLAQQVGSRDGKPPPYHQIEWAGYVTSFTRARIFDLAMNNYEHAIAFETDGLYATTPLTTDGDGSLGSWEVKEYSGITYVQSGVYWLNDTKGNEPEHWAPKYRGFDPDSLERDLVLQSWLEGGKRLAASSTRFRGMMAASVSPERFVEWKQWISEKRELTLYPRGKRLPIFREILPYNGLVRTMPTGGGGALSSPHKLAWVDEETKTMRDPFYAEDMELDEDEDRF
jgi:DNA polymerase type B, organellar and viral